MADASHHSPVAPQSLAVWLAGYSVRCLAVRPSRLGSNSDPEVIAFVSCCDYDVLEDGEALTYGFQLVGLCEEAGGREAPHAGPEVSRAGEDVELYAAPTVATYDAVTDATYTWSAHSNDNGLKVISASGKVTELLPLDALPGVNYIWSMVPDGEGCLYVVGSHYGSLVDGKRVLPDSCPVLRVFLPVPGGRSGQPQVVCQAEVPCTGGLLRSAAFDHSRKQLYVASESAIFRINGARAELVVRTGSSSNNGGNGGSSNGSSSSDSTESAANAAASSPLSRILTMAVVEGGDLLLIDKHPEPRPDKVNEIDELPVQWGWVCRVNPTTGHVSRLVEVEMRGDDTGGGWTAVLTVLPHGWLAVHETGSSVSEGLQLIQLGVRPSAPQAAAAAAAAAALHARRGRLTADLGALLQPHSEGAAGPHASDVTVRVGSCRFQLHRTILAARCPIFADLLSSVGSGVSGVGGRCEVPLPASFSAASFREVATYLYTAAVGRWDAEAAMGVWDLSHFLALPELCEEAAAQLLAALNPQCLAGALLWAHGKPAQACGALLERLVKWYVEHQAQVLAEASEAMVGLAEANGQLAVQLMRAVGEAYGRAEREAKWEHKQ